MFDFAGNENFPCLLLLFLIHLGGLALGTVPMILKLVIYTNQVTVLRVAKMIQTTPSNNKSRLQLKNVNPFHIEPLANRQTFSTYFKFVLNPHMRRAAAPELRVENLQFMKSNAYVAMWIFMAFFIGIVTCIVRISTDVRLQNNCTGCVVTQADAISNLVMAVWGLIAGPCTLPTRNHQSKDPLGILQEFRYSFYSGVFTIFGLVMYLINPVMKVKFNWLNFTLVQCCVGLYMASLHQVLVSTCTNRRNRAHTMNLKDCFDEVQADQNLKYLFRKHLDEEFSSEIYWFLDSVTEFIDDEDDEKATDEDMNTKAMQIYHQFVQSGAKYEVNLDWHTRHNLNVKIDTKKFSRDMFDDAVEVVKTSLLKDGFSRFLRTLDKEQQTQLVTLNI